MSTLETERTSLQTRLTETEQQLQEARQYAALVGEIRMSLGYNEAASPADILGRIQEMYAAMSRLAETLGSEVSIDVRVAELLSFQQETQRREAERHLEGVIASYTEAWTITSETGKAKIAALHKQFKRAILAEIKTGETPEVVAEQVWKDEIQSVAESVLQAISGPGAFVPPAPKSGLSPLSDDALTQLANRFVRA